MHMKDASGRLLTCDPEFANPVSMIDGFDDQGWHPIDSAPLGCDILGWDGRNMNIIRWEEPFHADQKGEWRLIQDGAYSGDYYWHPTHWQHLPKPPARY